MRCGLGIVVYVLRVFLSELFSRFLGRVRFIVFLIKIMLSV